MSGNSQQENTLRKREKERAGEREERGERGRAGFIKSLDNKLAPPTTLDGGKIQKEGQRVGEALFVAAPPRPERVSVSG